MINSKLGNNDIIDILLRSDKSNHLFTKNQKFIIRYFFKYYIKLFGYPPSAISRFMFRSILDNLFNESKDIKNILDIGCSFGFFSMACAEIYKNSRIFGIDINKENVRVANEINKMLKYRNLSFTEADILEIEKYPNIISNKFDLILILETLEHIKDDKVALDKIYSLLPSNGLLFVKVPFSENSLKYEIPEPAYTSHNTYDEELFLGGYHWRDGYTRHTLEHLLKFTGFNIERSYFINYPRKLPDTPPSFPLVYPLMSLINRISKNHQSILIKARKA